MKKISKQLIINILFIGLLAVLTVIALNLPVNWFVIVMPITAALIFAAILLSPDDKESK